MKVETMFIIPSTAFSGTLIADAAEPKNPLRRWTRRIVDATPYFYRKIIHPKFIKGEQVESTIRRYVKRWGVKDFKYENLKDTNIIYEVDIRGSNYTKALMESSIQDSQDFWGGLLAKNTFVLAGSILSQYLQSIIHRKDKNTASYPIHNIEESGMERRMRD